MSTTVGSFGAEDGGALVLLTVVVLEVDVVGAAEVDVELGGSLVGVAAVVDVTAVFAVPSERIPDPSEVQASGTQHAATRTVTLGQTLVIAAR